MGPFEWLLASAWLLAPAYGLVRLAVHLGRALPATDSRVWRGIQRALIAVTAICCYPFLMIFVGLCFVKPFFGARAAANQSLCQQRMRRLSVALQLYASDWNDTLPPASRWGSLAAPRLRRDERESAFRCPSARSPYSYAFNRFLDHAPLTDIQEPDGTVLLFESDVTSRDAAGDATSLSKTLRHGVLVNIACADGHVRRANGDPHSNLIWDLAPNQGTAQISKGPAREEGSARRQHK